MEGAESDWGKALFAIDGDTIAMLDGLRDYLWNIKGPTNIDAQIKAYLRKMVMADSEIGDEYEDDDDNWDDDEDDWGDDEDED